MWLRCWDGSKVIVFYWLGIINWSDGEQGKERGGGGEVKEGGGEGERIDRGCMIYGAMKYQVSC